MWIFFMSLKMGVESWMLGAKNKKTGDRRRKKCSILLPTPDFGLPSYNPS